MAGGARWRCVLERVGLPMPQPRGLQWQATALQTGHESGNCEARHLDVIPITSKWPAGLGGAVFWSASACRCRSPEGCSGKPLHSRLANESGNCEARHLDVIPITLKWPAGIGGVVFWSAVAYHCTPKLQDWNPFQDSPATGLASHNISKWRFPCLRVMHKAAPRRACGEPARRGSILPETLAKVSNLRKVST